MPLFNNIRRSLKHAVARWRATLELRRFSGKVPSGDAPVVVSVLRNEMLRLPRFFEYYRALGVKEFVIVDNNSTDGTKEYLSAREDVLLYSTQAHFVGKERWVNLLLRRHGLGRWCLVVDADELIDYPSSDSVRLPDLCRYFEGTGSNAVHAILLDLYPETSPAEVAYEAGADYFDKKWYFDPIESLSKAPRHFYLGSGLDYRFMGGMRARMFGVSPCCSKFPLIRYEQGMFLTDGQHYLEGGRFSELRAVLYHFKYLQDFAHHVREESRRGQYLWAAHEYKAYAATMEEGEHALQFRNSESILLKGARQLEECGFVVRPRSFEEFVQTSTIQER
jgi:hypothetical protein